MSHQCSNLLIRPMDFRLQPAIEKWLDQKGYNGDTDMIAVAGACKDFVKDPENCMGTYLWSELDTSYRLHQIKKIIVIMHQDCGAYGGEEAFENKEAEKKKLLADLDKFKDLALEKYPEIEVEKYWAAENDQSEWDFESIA